MTLAATSVLVRKVCTYPAICFGYVYRPPTIIDTPCSLSSKSRGIASLSLPVGNGAPRPKITPPLAVRTTTVMTVLPVRLQRRH